MHLFWINHIALVVTNHEAWDCFKFSKNGFHCSEWFGVCPQKEHHIIYKGRMFFNIFTSHFMSQDLLFYRLCSVSMERYSRTTINNVRGKEAHLALPPIILDYVGWKTFNENWVWGKHVKAHSKSLNKLSYPNVSSITLMTSHHRVSNTFVKSIEIIDLLVVLLQLNLATNSCASDILSLIWSP